MPEWQTKSIHLRVSGRVLDPLRPLSSNWYPHPAIEADIPAMLSQNVLCEPRSDTLPLSRLRYLSLQWKDSRGLKLRSNWRGLYALCCGAVSELVDVALSLTCCERLVRLAWCNERYGVPGLPRPSEEEGFLLETDYGCRTSV